MFKERLEFHKRENVNSKKRKSREKWGKILAVGALPVSEENLLLLVFFVVARVCST